MKQKLQFLALFLAISTAAIAQTFDVDNLRYTVISGTNVSVGKTNVNPTGALTIPATVVNGGTTYSVTAIASEGFVGCTGLTSVNIPNSVTFIGFSAFLDCTSLTSLSLPNSVTSIEQQVFAYCYGLTSVTIPNSVTSIGLMAFSGCNSLSSINIPSSVSFINQYAFLGCSGLSSVTVNWSTPLVINANVFQGVNTTVIPLNVPSGSEALYEANAAWTTFNPINAILSTEDFNRTKIIVYPNPTTNFITVSGLLNSESYVIYDITGRQLQNGILNNNDTINIENLATGKYLLQFSNGATSTILKK